jgi:MerR family transcriptional regulator, light-induced transcriptional regulator
MRNLFGREQNSLELQVQSVDGHDRSRYAAGVAALAISKIASIANKADAKAVVADSEVRALTRLAIEANESVVEAFIMNVVNRGVAIEKIYAELLAPSLKMLGVMWEDDTVGFAPMTVACWKIQKTLFNLAAIPDKASLERFTGIALNTLQAHQKVGRLFLACVPGTKHTFGIQILADIFRRNQWHVEVASATRLADIVEESASSNADVIGFSIGSDTLIPTMQAIAKDVRKATKQFAPAIIAGGPIFCNGVVQPSLIGVDYVCGDANDALKWASSFVTANAKRLTRPK